MTQTLMTIGEMADRLAAADGVNSAAYFARQIRSMVQRGILQPVTYQGEGRTAAAVFGEEGLCEARIMTVLARLGFSPEQMLDAHRCMHNLSNDDRQEAANTGPFRPGLPLALAGAKRGERWYFVLYMKQDRFRPDSGEDAGITGSFTRKPAFDNPVIQGLALASIVLDCLTLFQRLIGGSPASTG